MKRIYRSPVLTNYGDVTKLTREVYIKVPGGLDYGAQNQQICGHLSTCTTCP